jgi:D-arabinono-1,4-lactone oxidase
MKELGGRPHWAKNFDTTGQDIEEMYGDKLIEWRKIRSEADPEGMFVGEWHRRYIMGDGPRLALEEAEVERKKLWSGGVKVTGAVVGGKEGGLNEDHGSEESFDFLRNSEINQ